MDHAAWEKGITSTECFPKTEGDREEYPYEEEREDMRGIPGVVLAAPVESDEEKHQPSSEKCSSDEVNSLHDFLPGESD